MSLRDADGARITSPSRTMRRIAAGVASTLFASTVLAQPAQRPASPPLPIPLPQMPALNLPFSVASHMMQGASHLPHWRDPDAIAALGSAH